MVYLAKPITRCAQVGCLATTQYMTSFCKKHAQNKSHLPKKKSYAPYQTAFWNHQRTRTLASHPLCEACKAYNRIRQAQMVDHVWRWKHIGKSAMKDNWFQSLCISCHTAKTILEEQGIYRYYPTLTDYSLADYHVLVKRSERRHLGL